MKKTSLKNQILNRLKEFEGKWIHKGRIEERSKEWGYLAENGNRRCRELCEDGIIERKEEKGSVLYRYAKTNPKITQKSPVENYKPANQTNLW